MFRMLPFIALLLFVGACHDQAIDESAATRTIAFPLFGFTCLSEREDGSLIDLGTCPDTRRMLHAWADHWQVDVKTLAIPPSESGMCCTTRLPDGRTVVGIWIRSRGDPAVDAGTAHHERFHALCVLAPASVKALFDRLGDIGYDVPYEGLSEELRASVIEIIAIERSGVALDGISGTGLVDEAKRIVQAAKRSE